MNVTGASSYLHHQGHASQQGAAADALHSRPPIFAALPPPNCYSQHRNGGESSVHHPSHASVGNSHHHRHYSHLPSISPPYAAAAMSASSTSVSTAGSVSAGAAMAAEAPYGHGEDHLLFAASSLAKPRVAVHGALMRPPGVPSYPSLPLSSSSSSLPVRGASSAPGPFTSASFRGIYLDDDDEEESVDCASLAAPSACASTLLSPATSVGRRVPAAGWGRTPAAGNATSSFLESTDNASHPMTAVSCGEDDALAAFRAVEAMLEATPASMPFEPACMRDEAEGKAELLFTKELAADDAALLLAPSTLTSPPTPPPPLPSAAAMRAHDLGLVALLRGRRCAWDAVDGAFLCPLDHPMTPRDLVKEWRTHWDPRRTAEEDAEAPAKTKQAKTAKGKTKGNPKTGGEAETEQNARGAVKGGKAFPADAEGAPAVKTIASPSPPLHVPPPRDITCANCARHIIMDGSLVVTAEALRLRERDRSRAAEEAAAAALAAATVLAAKGSKAKAGTKRGRGNTSDGEAGAKGASSALSVPSPPPPPTAKAALLAMEAADAFEYEVNERFFVGTMLQEGASGAAETPCDAAASLLSTSAPSTFLRWWRCDGCRIDVCGECYAHVQRTARLIDGDGDDSDGVRDADGPQGGEAPPVVSPTSANEEGAKDAAVLAQAMEPTAAKRKKKGGRRATKRGGPPLDWGVVVPYARCKGCGAVSRTQAAARHECPAAEGTAKAIDALGACPAAEGTAKGIDALGACPAAEGTAKAIDALGACPAAEGIAKAIDALGADLLAPKGDAESLVVKGEAEDMPTCAPPPLLPDAAVKEEEIDDAAQISPPTYTDHQCAAEDGVDDAEAALLCLNALVDGCSAPTAGIGGAPFGECSTTAAAAANCEAFGAIVAAAIPWGSSASDVRVEGAEGDYDGAASLNDSIRQLGALSAALGGCYRDGGGGLAPVAPVATSSTTRPHSLCQWEEHGPVASEVEQIRDQQHASAGSSVPTMHEEAFVDVPPTVVSKDATNSNSNAVTVVRRGVAATGSAAKRPRPLVIDEDALEGGPLPSFAAVASAGAAHLTSSGAPPVVGSLSRLRPAAPPARRISPPPAPIAAPTYSHQVVIFDPPHGLAASDVIPRFLAECEGRHAALQSDAFPSSEVLSSALQGARRPVYRCFARMASCRTFVLQAATRAAADDALKALKRVGAASGGAYSYALRLSAVARVV